MLFEQHPGIRVWMHLDERSCAYFALGMARALRRPVATLCTSGTAGAEMYPAVIEAHYGRVPLVVLTADRPPELRDVGAPQTIDQLHLFGGHVKWFAEMALPESSEAAVRYVRIAADRAVATAAEEPAGPVHLNFPFREPLVPARLQLPAMESPPVVVVEQAPRVPDDALVRRVADALARSERGLIVCGPQDGLPAEAVASVASSYGLPILADPLSQVRCGPAHRHVIATYDAFLRDPSLHELSDAGVVLRFGAVPTSKPLTQYLQRQIGARHFLVDASGWNDPLGVTTDLLHVDPGSFCRTLGALGPGGEPSGWTRAWIEVDRVARDAVRHQLEGLDELFEGKVFAELAELLPVGSLLWAGSSMPVRDLDAFFPAGEKPIRFLANRGANGIDGVVSSALGAAAVAGPLVLVVGDLSFYHDMNGLMAARLHGLDATIILLNNDGGGIFSFLPQHEELDFEKLFGTPHGLDFRPAVEMYGGRFERVSGWDAFRLAIRDAVGSPGLSVIEVPTDRERNVAQHREVWARVSSALSALRGAVV
jgi:2-succinyl-5-enolpyruvyl-6-hydroxy-3-cyclohexene-1-carboxylate synthase